MEDLLLGVHVVVKTLTSEISRCHLADYVIELYLRACRMCSMIIFPQATNEIIVFWCRPCLSSLQTGGRRKRYMNTPNAGINTSTRATGVVKIET